MIEKDDGPAFPQHANTGNLEDWKHGMTLRDYFAGQALATMKLPNSWSDNPFYWDGVARSAYVCADAMLKAREQP